MPISMQQVADVAKVSRATVSDVLRNTWREKRISERTCRKVREALEKVNYRPNRVARSLVLGKTQTIGVQLPSFSRGHFERIVRHLDLSARTYGYHIFLSAPSQWQDEGEEIRRLCEHRVDGLILGLRLGRRLSRLFQELETGNVPFVFLGNAPTNRYYAVIDDDVSQAALAVEHLISLGHSRIAYIHGQSTNPGLLRRRRGYLETMGRHGFPVPGDFIHHAHFSEDLSRHAMVRMLALPQPPTAVYCASDTMAVGAIHGILDSGLRVPEDIAVVGHGDEIPFSWFTRVPLATIRQPAEEMAGVAMSMLIGLIQGQEPPERTIRLNGELVVRASSGKERGERVAGLEPAGKETYYGGGASSRGVGGVVGVEG